MNSYTVYGLKRLNKSVKLCLVSDLDSSSLDSGQDVVTSFVPISSFGDINVGDCVQVETRYVEGKIFHFIFRKEVN